MKQVTIAQAARKLKRVRKQLERMTKQLNKALECMSAAQSIAFDLSSLEDFDVNYDIKAQYNMLEQFVEEIENDYDINQD